MEIILLEEIPQLGYEGDVVTVKAGYARNFLIPGGKAITANKANKKMVEENQRQATHKREKVVTEAQEVAAKLNEAKITIPAKTGTSGKIFGSITTLQVSHALKLQGFEVDRKKISVVEEIKNLGTYHAKVQVHRDIEATVELNVVAEKEI
ncbi:MAG: 50S ribosomal protein L9 [Bacteroidia bacterium]